MRNMSFALTTQQILDQTKTVTRRKGWRFLKPGDLLQPVHKTQGLRKGEKITRLVPPIRVVGTSEERLASIYNHVGDVAKEGFLGWTCEQFIKFVCEKCKMHRDGTVTRIEFEYTEERMADREKVG